MLRGRTGLSPVMIGRHGALDRLQGLVDATEVAVATRSADGPSIALVSGEAGIGKTRLLREFVESLPSDIVVLSAQAQPGSMGRPFDVVGQLVAASDDGESDSVAEAAIANVAAALSGGGRAVLVIEDLHWADADSVYVIEQLCARPWPQLVVVGSYRGTDLSRKAPGGELVLRLERQHSVEQIRLDRLDRAEVAALLSAIGTGAPSSAAVEAVYRRSGGIPFVVEELVRCSGPDICTDDLKTAALPWSLDEAVRQQLAGLAADERKVVDALAVFGDPADFELLVAVCELDDARLLAALRALVANGVVVETSDDTFWFAHALVADAVHQQLLGRERRRLHERSLAALRGIDEPDHAALVRHALGAGQFDLIPAIAREGSRRYLDRGASFQALRLASEGLAEAPNDTELLSVATDAAWRLEYGSEALSFAQQWHAHAVTDLERVEALRFTARLHHELLRPEERDEILARMELLADQLPAGMARGRCAGAVAQVHMIADRGDKAIVWADRALAEARRTGDAWLEAQASVERASSFTEQRVRAEAEAALLHARELARGVGDGVLECRALNNLLAIVSPHGELGEWARREVRETAARCGLDKLGTGTSATWEAEAALARGDMRAMRQAVAESSERWATNGNKEHCHLQIHLAMLRMEEGLVAQALDALDATRDVRTFEIDRPLQFMVAVAGGNRDRAVELFDQLLAEPVPPDTSGALFALIEICLGAVHLGIAPERLRTDFLGRWGATHPSHDFVARHLEGPLRLSEGDAPGAAEALAAVLSPPDALLYVPTVASLRTSLAAALLAAGDRTGALAQAQQATALLGDWPGWRRDRAEALVRRLAGATRSDGELTTREREVAALIAEGLTNGQLAERLYISPKTAAVHVSNILTKLGLSSRVEIASWAVRHGVVLQPG